MVREKKSNVTEANGAQAKERLSRRALVVWLTAVVLYTMAVTSRTSFGVASVEAMGQFHIDASRLAVFATLQLGTYSLAQIPVGLAVDKFGPRKLLILGALVMGVGQVVLALSTSYLMALGARMLVGAGDATAFSSLMRLIPLWIPLRLTPQLSQLSAAVGQFGQFLSAVPFAALLQSAGWTVAFTSLGALGLLLALLAAVLIQDSPSAPGFRQRRENRRLRRARRHHDRPEPVAEQAPAVSAPPARSVTSILSEVFRSRVCWHGFFVHWTGLGTLVVFTMLWGVPMMTLGHGMSKDQAGVALTLSTIATVLVGPLVGIASARAGRKRWVITLAGSGVATLGWLWLIAPEQPRGFIAVIGMTIVMGVFAPVSNLGFDSVRENVDRGMLATGTGLANMGGWICGMIASQAIGWSLSLTAPAGDYGWADFRCAWLIVIGLWLFGAVGIVATKPHSHARESRVLRRLTSGN